MEITPWAVTNAYTFSILIILALVNHKNINRTDRNIKYNQLLIFIAVLLTADTLSRCDFLMPFASFWVRLGNFLTFALDPLGLFFAVSYVDSWIEGKHESIFLKVYNYVLLFFATLNFAVTLIQDILRVNIFYIYDENNVYHRGTFFILRGGIILAFLMILSVYSLIMKNNIDRHYRIALVSFPFMVLAGGLLQIVFAGVQFEYAGMTMGCLLIYLFLQSKDSNVDYLTNALNRRSLDNVIQNKIRSGKNFSGIMLDIDFFKRINDNYGHTVGDDALQLSAHILRRALTVNRHDVLIFRFGGDEFCIITDDKDEAALQKSVSDIREKLNFYNEKHRIPVELSFSIGSFTYQGKSQMSADDFLKNIDSKMYKDKKKHHAAREQSLVPG